MTKKNMISKKPPQDVFLSNLKNENKNIDNLFLYKIISFIRNRQIIKEFEEEKSKNRNI